MDYEHRKFTIFLPQFHKNRQSQFTNRRFASFPQITNRHTCDLLRRKFIEAGKQVSSIKRRPQRRWLFREAVFQQELYLSNSIGVEQQNEQASDDVAERYGYDVFEHC